MILGGRTASLTRYQTDPSGRMPAPSMSPSRPVSVAVAPVARSTGSELRAALVFVADRGARRRRATTRRGRPRPADRSSRSRRSPLRTSQIAGRSNAPSSLVKASRWSPDTGDHATGSRLRPLSSSSPTTSRRVACRAPAAPRAGGRRARRAGCTRGRRRRRARRRAPAPAIPPRPRPRGRRGPRAGAVPLDQVGRGSRRRSPSRSPPIPASNEMPHRATLRAASGTRARPRHPRTASPPAGRARPRSCRATTRPGRREASRPPPPRPVRRSSAATSRRTGRRPTPASRRSRLVTIARWSGAPVVPRGEADLGRGEATHPVGLFGHGASPYVPPPSPCHLAPPRATILSTHTHRVLAVGGLDWNPDHRRLEGWHRSSSRSTRRRGARSSGAWTSSRTP